MRRFVPAALLLLSVALACTEPMEPEKPFAVVENHLHAGADGGLCHAIMSTEGFTASTGAGWCELFVNGDTLEAYCLPNNTISERHAVLELTHSGKTIEVALSQDGQYANFLAIPEKLIANYADNQFQYSITTNVGLKVVSDHPEWCRAGISSSMVMISLSANPDLEPRDCKVTFSTDSKSAVVNVHQRGRFVMDCADTLVFPKIGGESTFEFYSADACDISIDGQWISCKVEGDVMKVSVPKTADLKPALGSITVKTASGHARKVFVSQKLLPKDYVGSFDFCFRSAWKTEKNQIYEYAVEAEWDEEAGQIVFDLVSYVLRFDYDPADGFLYLKPQRAYVAKNSPYDTWLGIVGTAKGSDGKPLPEYVDADPEITDWVSYFFEGETFDPSFRMLFKWDEGSLDRMCLTRCAESDFPIYRGQENADGTFTNRYGDKDFFVEECYAFRLGLFHVFYNSMDDERIDPDYMAFNHFPTTYRISENVEMYGPITLLRK